MGKLVDDIAKSLDSYDFETLRWVERGMKERPPLEILSHHGTMSELRRRGLIKSSRRIGWREQVLTRLGERVFFELTQKEAEK